jgi:haloacetate dehalogenase
MMDDFSTAEIRTDETYIFVRYSGSGPPLLFLHGFPQTHLMWHKVAPILTDDFTVICADLRGYGSSGCPESTPDHRPYSKRAMALDMVRVMEQLGFERFSIAGHDRGGRVAYRLALDHPQRIHRLAVLDVVPTKTAWDHADAEFALAFWPWSLLAQPQPLPEQILIAAPEAIVDNALDAWGSSASSFSPEVRATYVEALRDADHAHAICEEYRAAATIDRDHDAVDCANENAISCPLLVLWSKKGSLERWYEDHGGPIGIWREWSKSVQGHALNAGHFFPEECPHETAVALKRFFGN